VWKKNNSHVNKWKVRPYKMVVTTSGVINKNKIHYWYVIEIYRFKYYKKFRRQYTLWHFFIVSMESLH
jgi:hypothetical protein